VGEGEILGVVWPSVCGAVCATATADCDAPDWLVSYYIVPCEKLPPPHRAMRPFIKILWPPDVFTIRSVSDFLSVITFKDIEYFCAPMCL